MRTIFMFIFIMILIKVTHIDAIAWPVIKHGFAALNHLIQKAN